MDGYTFLAPVTRIAPAGFGAREACPPVTGILLTVVTLRADRAECAQLIATSPDREPRREQRRPLSTTVTPR
jgi:hypothetical protein